MMVAEVHMENPICLIDNRPDGTLVVEEKAMQILLGIRQPVVVVAIVGLYRTGKSYLMNRLAGKTEGFPLGATVQGQTKGIWMWCLPHPRRPNHTLVLLDTEGLGDVQKGNTQNDSWIFALAILLSSTLVYNSIGTIDQVALEKLHYVTELTKKIHTKSSQHGQEEENSAEFIRFFPDFTWAVRDFTLQLEIDGQPISEDEYLENALKLQEGNSEQIKQCNMSRLCIRKFFPTRKCFTFDRPANRRKLHQLEKLKEEDLEPDFLETAEKFCDHIWNTSRLKTVPGGRVVSGTMLANLAKSYVEAINSGQVPCLENAVQALAVIENTAAVREAISRYEELMEKRMKLPTETMEELLELHAECEREATGVFMARAFGDQIGQYQGELAHKLLEKKKEFCARNEQESLNRCHAVLMELSQELEDGIAKGIYSVPGGYQRFLGKQHEIEEKYRLVPGKGIQAKKALEEFLKSKKSVAESILQTDNALSEKEKEIEAERVRVQEAQRQQQLLEEEKDRLEQIKKDQEEINKKQLQDLMEKMEKEKKEWKEETERMVENKGKELERLLEEGHQQQAREMQNEIQHVGQCVPDILKAIFGGVTDIINAAGSHSPKVLPANFYPC
ncbi:PREDICTED: guanylate-binding protein 1-like [Gekko japonicus]|uniref:Guanylate-binding protein 1-like n=1 Tax=Gekko japonicus TaxID=146911 RepID=A0ABM1KZH8_GEKJA|nr:PREDICTED: guanylate-binding protein 1-like [Gekko japonicus]XP_015279116.1 PREDICTED: guanylate-binding protein 1-like [Gekko japonicus]